ncbi:phage related protein [Desulforamulus reducens MI-1]|uniref:Phage related protein n=1 Tax=Desulforamulus reducens (strain ATCC BAA-1160 / DSM 100696 / MI-1) TaxID=349161 RepID=A4J7R6_DESRM|nr:phage related protein [Desulforamulus reducens MI-1]
MQDFIDNNNPHGFYTSSPWLNVRFEVLQEFKFECQHCKARGFYKKADTVHHVQYVKKYPRLALSKTYIDNEGNVKLNLVPLCHGCHEHVHDYRRRVKKKPLTPERW